MLCVCMCACVCQVQRIYEYHKILMRLYRLTPKDHPDYHDLRYTITRVTQVIAQDLLVVVFVSIPNCALLFMIAMRYDSFVVVVVVVVVDGEGTGAPTQPNSE